MPLANHRRGYSLFPLKGEKSVEFRNHPWLQQGERSTELNLVRAKRLLKGNAAEDDWGTLEDDIFGELEEKVIHLGGNLCAGVEMVIDPYWREGDQEGTLITVRGVAHYLVTR